MLVCTKSHDLIGCSTALRRKADKKAWGLRGLKKSESDKRYIAAEVLWTDRSDAEWHAGLSLH